MAFTSLSSWALLVWEELNHRALDADAMFRQAGLDPTRLKDVNARFPVEKMQHLWAQARTRSDDPGLGVAIGERWHPTTFHALGYAWLASSTLAEGFHRLVRYGHLVSDASECELTLSGMEYHFRLRARNQSIQLDPATCEAIAIALVKMCRLLVGEHFAPMEITLPCAPGPGALVLETRLHCPLTFGERDLVLVLPRADMDKPLSSANPELSRINEQIAAKHLGQLSQDTLEARVRQQIIKGLPSGRVTERDIANALNLSQRSLQRRLAEEGHSFGDMLQTIRRELAHSYLLDSQFSINEVAYLLGFSEQANFTRACKRWFGVSPTAFRKQERLAG